MTHPKTRAGRGRTGALDPLGWIVGSVLLDELLQLPRGVAVVRVVQGREIQALTAVENDHDRAFVREREGRDLGPVRDRWEYLWRVAVPTLIPHAPWELWA